MSDAFNRAEIERYLNLFYTPEHGPIELDVLMKSGFILPGHFDKPEALLAEIEKYDGIDDVSAIYTGLNRIKPEAFASERAGGKEPLKLKNKVAPGGRTNATDISRVVSLLIDIDPIRTHGDKKDSTTESEHDFGLEAAEVLKEELASMGWPEPVMGDSGNGGQLRYRCDLPANEEISDLIRRALEAANSLLPEDLREQVEVDSTVHDLPRISKVLGTITRKGPGTTERPWRRSRILSAPDKLEEVQLESIRTLIRTGGDTEEGKKRDKAREHDSKPPKAGNKTLAEVVKDETIKPCLKEIILNCRIKELGDAGVRDEHRGRVAIATELLIAGYSDLACHEFFSRMEDYDPRQTTSQLNQIHRTWTDKGKLTWNCSTLRNKKIILAGLCEGCKYTGHGREPIMVYKILIEADDDVIEDEAVLEDLARISLDSPIGFAKWMVDLKLPREVKAAAKKAIKQIADKIAWEQGVAQSQEKSTEKISHIDDEDIIRLAERKEGSKFQHLMAGVIEGFPSKEEACSTLLREIAYYSDSEGQIERVFKKSKIYDENRTYRDEISNAIKSCEGHFKLSEDDTGEEILTNERRLHDVTNDTMGALEKTNDPPKVFARSRDLCRVVRDDHNLPSIEVFNPASLRRVVSRSARFIRLDPDKSGKLVKKEVFPPTDVIRDIMAASQWPFPRLVGVSATPIVRVNGSICTEPGYDPISGIFYDGNMDLNIPEMPTAEDAKNAIDYVLKEVFSEFPFVDDASMLAMLAGMITPLIRPMIPGLVPMLVVTKATPGTGASLLMDLLSMVSYGMPCATSKFVEDDTENDKRITSLLVAGRTMICWDNVDRVFKSASVNRLTTSEQYESRILGASKSVTFDNKTCTYVTGNNVQLAGDMPRRCYFSKMEAKEARPWEQTEFRHPQIKQWVLEHRKELVEALLTAVKAWVVNGRPKGKSEKTIGSYEMWVEILDGILSYAGTKGFLANLGDFYEEEDSDASDMGLFLQELYTMHGGSGIIGLRVLESYLAGSLGDVAPAEISDALGKSGKLSALGIALKMYNNRRFEGNDSEHYYVMRVRKNKSLKKNEYFVDRVPKKEAQTRFE